MTKSRDIADSINRIDSSAADATAVTIDASENVGIGTNSPTSKLHISNSSAPTLRLENTDTTISEAESVGLIEFYSNDASTGGTGVSGSIKNVSANATGNSYATVFSVGNASGGSLVLNERARIDNDGLKFNGDTAAANALDDYEEGTFTPTYLGSTTNPTVTYDSQTSGSYVKIGRQVIAKIILRTDSVSGGGGSLFIGGLPFLASAASGNRAGTLNVGYTSNFVTEAPQSGYINDGNTYAILVTNQSSDARSDSNNGVCVSNMQTGTNDNFIMATLIYET